MNDNLPLDERYLGWLYSLVEPSRQRYSADYWKLCQHLYNTEFGWFIHNDDNRMEDGRELRLEFFHVTGGEDEIWQMMDASILEVLIALARRIGFEQDQAPGPWFWFMITNLGLIHYEDSRWTHSTRRRVDAVTEMLINRTYRPNGQGGLFPLRHPNEDQREVEIWYQMSAYLLENMD